MQTKFPRSGFVPFLDHQAMRHAAHEVKELARFVRTATMQGTRPCVFLTGAGCSTESGIPDYRSPQGLYSRKGYQPMTQQTFLGSPAAQRRYWARSMRGFPELSSAAPSGAHTAISQILRGSVTSGGGGTVLTQNVDGLHLRSLCGDASVMVGDPRVVELHGSLWRVACHQCGAVEHREAYQQALRARNPSLAAHYDAESAASAHLTAANDSARPDGDYDVHESFIDAMQLVPCAKCIPAPAASDSAGIGAGLMKPGVVLFGGNVPQPITRQAFQAVEGAACLVCVGTSLQVYSAYQYVDRAKKLGVPVAVVNVGPTRADDRVDLKIEALVGEIMPQVALELQGDDAYRALY